MKAYLHLHAHIQHTHTYFTLEACADRPVCDQGIKSTTADFARGQFDKIINEWSLFVNPIHECICFSVGWEHIDSSILISQSVILGPLATSDKMSYPPPPKKINNLALDSHSPHGPCHSPVSLSADVMWAGTGAIGLKLFWRQRALPPALTLNSLSTPQWEQPVQNTPSSQDMARPPPPSLCTCGSCSFIANWTFHSERNNYSQEKRGLPWNADMTCNVTLPLKIEEVNTLPSQSPARNTERKRERGRVCMFVSVAYVLMGDSEYIKDIAASRWETRWVSRDKEEVTSYLLDLLERRKAHHYRSWFLARRLAEGSCSSSQLVKWPLRESVCVCVCEREKEGRAQGRRTHSTLSDTWDCELNK